MESILGKVIIVHTPLTPGFQLAIIIQKHKSGLYRLRMIIEGKDPVCFFLEESEVLAADPRPFSDYEVIESIKEDQLPPARKQRGGPFPFRKDAGEVN